MNVTFNHWKLVWRTPLPSALELYDIGRDRYEKTNVADSHPEIVAQLQRRAEEVPVAEYVALAQALADARRAGRRVLVVFWSPESAPSVEAVYPPGFDTTVSVGAVARPLEGAARPGHFDGVATVVAILFGLVGAERAYFGQKDAQQVMVIR